MQTKQFIENFQTQDLESRLEFARWTDVTLGYGDVSIEGHLK
jgi:hypothetical protein